MPGLRLPADVVTPFDLRCMADDLHVMAYFAGHPVYEAVEAMIRRSSSGQLVVRAILTRHDQTQIDHVNADLLMAAARATRRETCFRSISVVEDRSDRCPRLRVEFVSQAGEAIAFDVKSASPPDASRGGLSDPGDHAAQSILPLMWRGRSALAGAESRVWVNGIEYAIPVKLRAGPRSEERRVGKECA